MNKNSVPPKKISDEALFPSFKKAFTHTFVIRGLKVTIGLLSGIILARLLGPGGRGELALFVVTVQMLLPIGTLVYGSNSILMGEKSERKRKLIIHTLLFVTFVSFIVFLFILFLSPSTRAIFLGNTHLLLVGLLICLLWTNMMEIGLRELLLAQQDFFSINYIQITGAALYLLLLVIFLWVLHLGIRAAIIALIGQQFLMMIIYLGKLYSRDDFYVSSAVFKIDYPLLKKSISINKRTFLAGIPTLLLLKVDIWILGIFATSYSVGLYQITVTVCMSVMILGEITNQIAKGKAVSESGDQVIKSSLLASKLIFITGLLGYAVIIFWGKDLLGFVYGKAFIPSYKSLEILYVAAIFWASTLPLVGFLVGRYKYPRTIVIGMSIAVILNIGLNIILIPTYLEVGAAFASLIAYCVMAVIFVGVFKRRSALHYKYFFSFSDREMILLKKYLPFFQN